MLSTKSWKICIVMGLLLLGGLGAYAQTTTFEFQEGINGYAGTSDMTYFLSDPGALTGADPEWEWDGDDGGLYNVGVLHFADIIGDGEGQIPPGSSVVEAFISLYITNEGSSAEVATLHNLLKPFDEDLDFIEFTLNFEPVAGEEYDEEVIAEIPGPAAGEIIQVDVTSSLVSWLSGADNFGWLFMPGGGNGVGVQSSEVPVRNVPKLIVNTPLGEFVFAEGENGYLDTVDTWINTGENFETVFGGDTEFEWDGEDDGWENYGLLRFDNIFGNAANQIPPGTPIDSAVIVITIVDAGEPATLHEIVEGIDDRSTDFNDETTSMGTWGNTFEPEVGNDYNEDAVGTIEGTIGENEVDVTASIQSYSDGAVNRGWIIVPSGTNGVVAVASEQAHNPRPLLVINTPDGNFEFQNGEDGYTGTVDTFINTTDNFNVVYGQNNAFEWDGEDAGGENIALLRFDNIFGDGPGQVPPGTTINSANIYLTVINEGSPANIHEILEGTDERPTRFDETTTSMETWGDTFFPEAGVDYVEEVLTVAQNADAFVNEGRLIIDVTSSVEKYSSGEPNTGWIMFGTGSNGVEMVASDSPFSSEPTGPPKLTVIIEGGTGIDNFSIY